MVAYQFWCPYWCCCDHQSWRSYICHSHCLWTCITAGADDLAQVTEEEVTFSNFSIEDAACLFSGDAAFHTSSATMCINNILLTIHAVPGDTFLGTASAFLCSTAHGTKILSQIKIILKLPCESYHWTADTTSWQHDNCGTTCQQARYSTATSPQWYKEWQPLLCLWHLHWWY